MSLVKVLLNNEGTAHLHTWLQVSSLHMDIHLLSNAVNTHVSTCWPGETQVIIL